MDQNTNWASLIMKLYGIARVKMYSEKVGNGQFHNNIDLTVCLLSFFHHSIHCLLIIQYVK